jgi:hypothetical protein
MSIVMISTDYLYILFFDTEIDSSRGANTDAVLCVGANTDAVLCVWCCAMVRRTGGGRAAQLLLQGGKRRRLGASGRSAKSSWHVFLFLNISYVYCTGAVLWSPSFSLASDTPTLATSVTSALPAASLL